MKHLILGTAGHVDHGKTSLIRALTGRQTDRLKEEQKRGISIELGFTYFDLEKDLRVGIVDVPGHEKFIRNMVQGVSGMDLVMLVIAADEGIMPQTIEHLNILKMLGVEHGFVALTKTDLVDEEWIELVTSDIRDALKGTFLENSEIVRVSNKTLEGIDDIKNILRKHADSFEKEEKNDTPRLPIDRVFVISGFGTIVTGTLMDGKLSLQDEIEIYPERIKTKIRSIQVHQEPQDVAYDSQRCALNIPGVKKEDIHRGSVISLPDALKNTNLIDVKIECIKDQERAIKNGSRVFLYIGTEEILARVVLLDRDVLNPGEEGYAQLILESETVCKRMDRFILRFYSPMSTIAGGVILETNPKKKKRFDEDAVEEFKINESGSDTDVLNNLIYTRQDDFLNKKEIAKLLSKSEDLVDKELNDLVNEGTIKVYELKNGLYPISLRYIQNVNEELIVHLNKYYEKYPLRRGIFKEEIKNRFFKKLNNNQKLYEYVLGLILDEASLELNGELVSIKGYAPSLSDEDKKSMDMVLNMIEEAKYDGITKEEIQEKIKINLEFLNEALQDLQASKSIYRLQDDYISYKAFLNAREELIKFLNNNQEISLAEFRDLISSNRKISLALLEDFDKANLTKRLGDKRVLKR